MDLGRARRLFNSQKHGAKQRGIGWELSFEQWLTWWGDDIDRRGSRLGCLQMQRFCDSGPYALGNIRKGEPSDNIRTRFAMAANRRAAAAARAHQAALDALPVGTEDEDDEGALRSHGITRWHHHQRDGEPG